MRVHTTATLSIEENRWTRSIEPAKPVERHSMQAAMRVARVEADQHPGRVFSIYENQTLASIIATVTRTSQGRFVWLREDVK